VNVFSSDTLLETLAEARFPGRAHSIEYFRVEGHFYRLLTIEGRPVTVCPFFDFVEPVEAASPPPAAFRELSFLPRVAIERVAAESWKREAEADGVIPAPYIDWTSVPDWESWTAKVQTRRSQLFSDAKRKARKLESTAGALSYVLDDRRPWVFETLLRWKSAQYRATGLRDLFADAANVRFFRALLDRKLANVSSLFAGASFVAAHLAVEWESRFYSWLPGYDRAFAAYSPGLLLFLWLIEQTRKSGASQFDFMNGGEEYKFLLATHVREVQPVGLPPLTTRVRSGLRAGVKSALARSPWLREATADVRQWLRR
jgi:hypothetical protein